VKFRFDPILNPRLDGSKTPCDFRLSPEEVVKLDLSDEKRVKEWRKFCEKFIGPSESDNLYICGAGISTFHIDPYGKMSACEMTRFQNYDLRCGSFKEGWYKSIPEFLTLKPKGDYPCGKCDLISLCGQCPGWGWLENGSPEAPVDYLCRIAHLRVEEFYGSNNSQEENDDSKNESKDNPAAL
jgi:radical SAM protein with 4Fe4S-binding SPASM domain